MKTTAYLGLGSNLGDREAHIRAALDALGATPGVEVVAVSNLRETAPVGGPAQGAFLNGAAEVATTLPARGLLALCQELERRAGRDPSTPRNHPRELDLDILLFGDEVIDEKGLCVPHPRISGRAFVLEPLAELGVDPSRIPEQSTPRVVREAAEFAELNNTWQRGGCVTGLVPTMGALHEGHASLMRIARGECDRVAATIFVNPLQFGPDEDLERYPRDLDHDLEVLRAEGVDAVFVPPPDAVYPDGFCSNVSVGAEASDMEGVCRPGHFEGVATVVAKLFAVARPTNAYFGRKDAQQLAVIRRMVDDLGFAITVRACPIVREPDGLALSSRNVYLSAEERQSALCLSRALRAARDAHRDGERDQEALLRVARAVIAAEPAVDLEYLELRKEDDLRVLPAGPVAEGRMLLAARVGVTRLIDNCSLTEP